MKLFIYTSFLLVSFSLIFPLNIYAIDNYIKYANNPLIQPYSAWNTSGVTIPEVYFDGNNYLMWFSGFSGSNMQIGFATSDDGITWNTYPDPVISGLNVNRNVLSPSVIKVSNYFIMYYSADDKITHNALGIFRAESLDGINWTTNDLPVFNPSGGYSHNATGADVILANGQYYMWFNSSYTGNWTIGLATSSDGLNWIEYFNNPVLKGDELWDGSQVGGPSVIYKDGKFHMWYGTNSVSVSHGINYAISDDGIIWSKPSNNNPIITTGVSGSWDQAIGDGTVIYNNNMFMMWYGGGGLINNTNAARIGLATSNPITPSPTPSSTPTPTNTPAPTSTPAPTVTPTPTFTPTPTTMPVTKAVLLPGFGGSWNRDAILNCKPDSYTGEWSLIPFEEAMDTYDPLTQGIGSSGLTPLWFYYDWRKSPTDLAYRLKDFVDSETQPEEKVYLVTHSYGGIVARAYLELDPKKTEKLVTIGTPHKGLVKAYPAWSAGTMIGDWRWKLAGTLITSFCKIEHPTESPRDLVRTYIPSVRTLLPVFDYLIPVHSDTYIPFSSQHVQNTYLNSHIFESPYEGIPVTTLYGTGFPTLSGFTVKNPNKLDNLLGNWQDGKPHKTVTGDGDGTVLASAATVPGSTSIPVGQNHGNIVSSVEGVLAVLDALYTGNQPTIRITNTPEPESVLVMATNSDSELMVNGPAGMQYSTNDGMIVLIDPKEGGYSLKGKMKPTDRVVIIRISDNMDKQDYSYVFPQSNGNINHILRIVN